MKNNILKTLFHLIANLRKFDNYIEIRLCSDSTLSTDLLRRLRHKLSCCFLSQLKQFAIFSGLKGQIGSVFRSANTKFIYN